MEGSQPKKLAGVNTVLSQAMAAVEQPRQSLAISLSRGLVVIVAFVLLGGFLWGVSGVWIAFPATELVTFALAAVLYVSFERHRAAGEQQIR